MNADYEEVEATTGSLTSLEGLTRASYQRAADLLDGYVHESHFLRDDDSPDNRIVWASEGFAALLGCSIDEYNRAKWGGYYHHEERQAAIERARRLRRGEMVEAEVRVRTASGEDRWLYVKNRPLYDPRTRRVIGILGIGQDITQRKLTEQDLRMLEREVLEISNREQQRLATELHDGLGQQLSGIAMMLRSIAHRHAQDSTDLSVSLNESIRLLNRSIHEARTLASSLAPLEIGFGGLVGALAALATHTKETSGIDSRFATTGRLASVKSLSSSDNELYRIAQEAIHNALRHSHATTIRINVRVHRDGLLLRIHDNGRGIDERAANGDGMGLRIMAYRARTMGAHLLIRRSKRGGTSILCHVPELRARAG